MVLLSGFAKTPPNRLDNKTESCGRKKKVEAEWTESSKKH